jgi:GT2 family glycosyltransferase
MATSCSLVVVNYHSAPLAIEAVRTARAAARDPLQVIIVDNSVDSAEANALREHADVLIVSEANIGYGAAINRARAKADGEVLLVCNPDVRFGAGSIDILRQRRGRCRAGALLGRRLPVVSSAQRSARVRRSARCGYRKPVAAMGARARSPTHSPANRVLVDS